MARRVGILMGGPSCERDVSIKSGKAVYQALYNKGIEAVCLELEPRSDLNGYKGWVRKRIIDSKIDVAFIALHGEFGEDGSIQEILEGIKLPYTGSRVDASKLGMDKIRSRYMFEAKKIPVPRYKLVQRLDKGIDPNIYFKELGGDLVIKPYNGGSSIGLSIVDSEVGLDKALKNAFRYSDTVIIEEYIKGREITVGILGDRPLPVVEIIPKKAFFDFEAKYEKDLTEYKVPANISVEQFEESQKLALMAHTSLGARFFSRVDMILSDKAPIVLELNTIPGLTETSLVPKAIMAVCVEFEDLVVKILGSA
ncbi:MAG: D-alanine--D-alanine ligase [Candidatus Omnitrophota bacterium]|nr:D-alanine--D-alanine ligase [Candidatus Omnitrophota bacterium]